MAKSDNGDNSPGGGNSGPGGGDPGQGGGGGNPGQGHTVTIIVEGTPHPGYHARSSLAKLFSKFRGKLWIDKADYQWVKTEAEVTDNISWGLFVARLSKGAHLDVEMTRVNDEVWLPKRIEARASARLALVKKYNIESDTNFSNYRKFQVESRVVGGSTAP